MSGRLHVGFVLATLVGGGAERVVLTLADSLIERGHRVDLIMGRLQGEYRASIPRALRLYYPRLWPSNPPLRRYCRERGISVIPVDVNPAAAAWAWRKLRKENPSCPVNPKHALYAYAVATYVRKERPHALMATLPVAGASTLYAAELTGHSTPAVVSVHNNIGSEYTAEHLCMAKTLYPAADAIVAVSNGVAGEAARILEVPAEKIRTIYNPISPAAIWRLAQEPLTHPWFSDGQPPVILTAGRQTPAKDYRTLVEAFALACQKRRARLAIAGSFSESYKSDILSHARTLGVEQDMQFLGFDENLFRYMRRAGLFALSSRWEGLPMVLLEALACGTPVASADAPYGPGEILEGGKWGKLAPVGDAPALSQAMVEILEGDRPPEGALKRRASDFSRERAADAYIELFEDIVR